MFIYIVIEYIINVKYIRVYWCYIKYDCFYGGILGIKIFYFFFFRCGKIGYFVKKNMIKYIKLMILVMNKIKGKLMKYLIR